MKKHILLALFASLLTFAATAQGTLSSSSSPKRISWRPTIPRPTSPARLVIDNVRFEDANGDNRIDANETFSIDLTIRNTGSGSAYMIKPDIRSTVSGSQLLFSEQQTIKMLTPGEEQTVRFAGKSSQSLPDGTASIIISAREGNGFNPDPHTLNISCHAFRPPKVVIGQYAFASAGGGVPRPNEIMTLKMIVQNDGESAAENVRVDFTLPKNVYQGAETTYVIARLDAGEQHLIEFPFFTNNAYQGETLTIDTRLSESYGRYSQKVDRMPTVNLSHSLTQSASTTIEAKANTTKPTVRPTMSLISDVNENIPVVKRSQPNVFALVIGNENYTNGKDIDVPFANSDASTFAEYMGKTIGVPSSNITLIHDGTSAKLQTEIERVAKLAKSYTDRGEKPAQIIFYYAGHGLTNNNHDGYLLPVDITATNINRGIRTADMYNLLASSGAEKVTVFIDACFSGATRGSSSLLEGRGVVVEPNADVIKGNLVVFTATSKDQIAYAYNDKLHGLFTYYLLAKLKETSGNVNYQELRDYLDKEIKYQSLLIHYTEQTPSIIISPDVSDRWHDWRLTAQ